jgi:hypothetical protein
MINKNGGSFHMFGAVVRGLQAPVGDVLLGHATVQTESEPILVVRRGQNQEGDEFCLVMLGSGEAFIGQEDYLRNNFWNVTKHVRIDVPLDRHSISPLPPRVGEIGFDGESGDWIVGVTTSTNRRWVGLTSVRPDDTNSAKLRFPSWRRVHDVAPGVSQTLFSITASSE